MCKTWYKPCLHKKQGAALPSPYGLSTESSQWVMTEPHQAYLPQLLLTNTDLDELYWKMDWHATNFPLYWHTTNFPLTCHHRQSVDGTSN